MQLMSWAAAQGPDVTHDLANAITLAQELHKDDFRESGDPYITHPIAVALILAEHGADPTTVVTAVLHDLDRVTTIDAKIGPERDMTLRAMFGNVVIDLLAEFAALDKYEHGAPPAITDQRVLVIKVFDRLHNMRTICHHRPEKQQRKATHTSAVVAPLARQLGLAAIGDELDTLSAATLRVHAVRPQLMPRTETSDKNATGLRALHGTLRVAVHILPNHCRARWIQEWEGELSAAGNLPQRLRFVADVLRGLPTMAVLCRRSSS